MIHTYSTSGACPTAHIAVNRNRLKHYGGTTVYLKNGTHFEIELFNPKSVKILAKIHVNGQPISNSGIVLKPGERIFLERWIDAAKKFKFETYEVENSNEAASAIANNGSVTVHFHDESVSQPGFIYYPSYPTYPSNPVWADSPIITCNSYYNSTGPVYSAKTTVTSTASSVRGIETGRAEQGNSSNQTLISDSSSFSSQWSAVASLKILPESHRLAENYSAIRNYCGSCGARMKNQNWKFCPTCGTKV